MYIFWYRNADGSFFAQRKATLMGAKRAFLKYRRTPNSDSVREYGWTVAEDAEPGVRRAAGLPPFAY